MVQPYPSVPHGQVKFLGIDMNDNNGKYYKIRRLKGIHKKKRCNNEHCFQWFEL